MKTSLSTTPSAENGYARAGLSGASAESDERGCTVASIRGALVLDAAETAVDALVDDLTGWESEPGPGPERYAISNDLESADMTFHELRHAVFEGRIRPETMLIRRGPPAVELEALGVSGLFARKSRALCALLALFFGVFGADRIYIGHIGLGFAKGLLFVLGLLSIASSHALSEEPLLLQFTQPSLGAMLIHGALGWTALDLVLLLISGLRTDGEGVPIAWR